VQDPDDGRPVIAVQLSGGLGNQLFSYAMGRAAALAADAALWLDTSFHAPGRGAQRRYELDALAIAADHVLALPQGVDPAALAARIGGAPVLDGSDAGAGQVLAAGAPLVLAGYPPSRSSHLFDPAFRARMLAETRLKGPGSDAFRDWAARIDAARTPVFVHVRLGDYLKLPDSFCIPDSAWYRAALARIDAVAPGAEPFLCSDDPAGALDRIDFGRPVTALPVLPAPEALELHRRCHHFICAASTFGWWSAYLGTHPARTVIFPRRYFVNDWLQARYETVDYLDPGWLRL
jgi:hypothetical protein